MTVQPTRIHPHRRLRQPGDAADRAPRARGRRLLRDRSVQHAPTRRSSGSSPRASSCPAARLGHVGGQPARAAAFLRQRACRSSASATASRRWRTSWAAGRRAGREPRVRPRLHRDHRRERPVRRPVEVGETPPGVDEPRRPGRAARAEGFKIVARSRRRAVRDRHRRGAALLCDQFHPEVVHTPDGGKLLANFVRHVCGCAGDWTMAELPRRQDRRHPRPGRRAAR